MFLERVSAGRKCRKEPILRLAYSYELLTQTCKHVPMPHCVDDILWPEFNQLAEARREYLDEATERIIREEVFKGSGDPEDR